jgi:hypothetical protein
MPSPTSLPTAAATAGAVAVFPEACSMILATTDVPALAPAEVRQRVFVGLLPRVEAGARAAFRRLRCPHGRADAVARP